MERCGTNEWTQESHMARTKKPEPPVATPPAESFDENTPPPRGRPEGVPIGVWVVLPPGQEPAAEFVGWDRTGRVPAGSVLCEFTGQFGTMDPVTLRYADAGYRVAANPWEGGRELAPLGPVDARPAAGSLDPYRITAIVVGRDRSQRYFVVLSPR